MVNLAKKFYITAPLYYVNAKPHIGHAYTTIVADVIARWHRLKGEKVFFLTGTDEHGEKVFKAAEKSGKNVEDFVDEIADEYKKVWKFLNISYDDFIRTTEKRHKNTVKEFIEHLAKKGEIYKGEYEGYYCRGCESFKTETELVNELCPDHGIKAELRKEETYFFKLSKYEKEILKYLEKHSLPSFRVEEIKNRVKEGLKDLSITRINLKWGIPFPLDKKHVVYVWFDALLNYISALGWPDKSKFRTFWPADLHLIGKEINWFHSVVWPSMLLSAGIKTPGKIFAHGWWLVNGQKISKSLGNIIDPVEISKKYSVDALRYFLIRDVPFGEDGNFVEEKLIERINGELVADLGNLVYRVLSLAEKFKGKIQGEGELIEELDLQKIDEYFEKLELHNALEEIWKFVRRTNKYINEKEPWRLSGKELSNVLYNLLESVRIIGILVSPFLPQTSEKIFEQLGVRPGKLKDCRFKRFSGKIKKGKYIFEKVG